MASFNNEKVSSGKLDWRSKIWQRNLFIAYSSVPSLSAKRRLYHFLYVNFEFVSRGEDFAVTCKEDCEACSTCYHQGGDGKKNVFHLFQHVQFLVHTLLGFQASYSELPEI